MTKVDIVFTVESNHASHDFPEARLVMSMPVLPGDTLDRVTARAYAELEKASLRYAALKVTVVPGIEYAVELVPSDVELP